MNQSNSSKQVLLSVIGVAILVVAVVGVSFAFFNYTRTGSANQVTTGTIHFNSSQTYMNVENAFPITKTAAQQSAGAATNENVTTAVVTITGDTTYGQGLDFRITAQEVNLAAGNGTVPISVLVTSAGTLTDETNTGDSITTHDYENGTIRNGSVLASGTINGTGASISETITVKAFIDSQYVAITDTPQSGEYDPAQSPETGYAANSNGSNASNGTTSGWINGRTVLTTTQWNALALTPASFKIRVESINHNGSYAYTYS